MTTIPQIFVGGELIGGSTDVMEAFGSGKLQRLLDNCGVEYDRSLEVDPFSFLPVWLHRR
jgi:cysteine synthase A